MDQTQVSCIAGRFFFNIWVTREAYDVQNCRTTKNYPTQCQQYLEILQFFSSHKFGILRESYNSLFQKGFL